MRKLKAEIDGKKINFGIQIDKMENFLTSVTTNKLLNSLSKIIIY